MVGAWQTFKDSCEFYFQTVKASSFFECIERYATSYLYCQAEMEAAGNGKSHNFTYKQPPFHTWVFFDVFL